MADIEFFKHQRLIVLRNRGRIDPERIEEYIAFDGYEAVGKALDVHDARRRSSPRSRRPGSAAGAARVSRRAASGSSAGEQPATPKYIICNGDEGDPGAFMDRSVLEADPHAVLEGMVIGAKAIGAARGFIYIRDEYPLAVSRIGIALDQARALGCSARTSSARDSISTSRSCAAPGPSSRARRRP